MSWARLQTSHEYWNRHGNLDNSVLLNLRRFTSFNLDPEMQTASAESVEQLGRFPFIYTKTVADLSRKEMGNFAEYLRRGGFVFINACRNTNIFPKNPVFLRQQIASLRTQFPDLRLEVIEPTHPIYTCHFPVPEHPDYPRTGDPAPLTALYDGDRLIGMINLSGLKCLWSRESSPENQARLAAGIELMANIYFYVMTHR